MFLNQVADQLRDRFGDDIKDVCLVVPTRRAVLFLREAIAASYRRTILAPTMLSIQDFVLQVSGQQVPEKLVLVFELYQAYLAEMRKSRKDFEEPFDRFYAWGELLLKDFDELDKYCVDAEKLFTNVRDLKEIEAFFADPDIELEGIRQFWSTLPAGSELSDIQKNFLVFWERLPGIYHRFQHQLKEKNLAYEGMAYRQLADEARSESLELPWEATIFVGFYALNRAEERIVEFLLSEQKGTIYWDADRSYYDPDRKALKSDPYLQPGKVAGLTPGRFIKQYHEKWKNRGSQLILTDMLSEPKDVWLCGAPLLVSQARFLGQELGSRLEELDDPRRNAVVLADENLLFPVLYSLPSELQTLNITMGFPLSQTAVYHLLMTALSMLDQAQKRQGSVVLPYRLVLALIDHPAVRSEDSDKSLGTFREEIIAKNQVWIDQTACQNQAFPTLFRLLCDLPIGNQPPAHWIRKILEHLQKEAEERDDAVEAEYIFYFYRQLNQLQGILEQYATAGDQIFARLWREVMGSLRIPFEGEPLEGLQIMGFLESRVLDFERVFILGANEGNLPDRASRHSFIPFNLRKAFGIPTFEEKDTIYAYHFFRLLQRAKEVYLVYNTEVNDMGGTKEQSRFLQQLRYFFTDQPNLRVHEKILLPPSPTKVQGPIVVPLAGEVKQRLIRRFVGQPNGQEPERSLSATAINTYRRCPLQFYFQYLADLEESDEVEEAIERSTFGLIFHETLEKLYQPFATKAKDGEPLQEADFESMLSRLEDALKEVFARHNQPLESLEGKNLLMHHIIRTLCRHVIAHDRNGYPFQVAGLEKSLSTPFPLSDGHWVRLKGILDRIDYLPESGIWRIIDYKTGKIDLGKSGDPVAALEKADKKEVLQGYIYGYLFRRQMQEAGAAVGFYSARNMASGLKDMAKGKVLDQTLLDNFEEVLREQIEEMLGNDFTQTEDEKYCAYCNYREICSR